ncbi:hypothetical protein N3K66_009062 [Trichothecium roseum]|uniref:Uncharacterized protein n=1 Tax=Trichothecium roseum TaxID=47278 RepID=A0ACC0UPH2_9HYPO|nr:hypothetical protein N3K66_009062 [Trichothecium roseum]
MYLDQFQPLDVHDYDGSGEWTKIYSLGLEVMEDSSVRWRAYNYRGLPERFIFTIPEETPAGDYLLRMDLVVPGLWEPPIYTADVAQLYATCAHLSIASEATGSLPEGIKIPEGFYTTELAREIAGQI